MASRLILSTPPLVRPPVLGWPLARPGFPAPAISNLFYFKFCSRYVRSGPLSTNFAPLGSLLAAPRARGADHEYFRQDYVQDFSSRRGDGLGRRAPKLLHRPTGLRHQGFPVGAPAASIDVAAILNGKRRRPGRSSIGSVRSSIS